MIHIEPTSDIFIKYLFGKEEHKDFLLQFINAVHKNSDFPLMKTIEIKNPFNIRNMVNDKESILDIKATDENGRIYNIEMQTSGNEIFKHRSLFYWAKLYSSQLDKGDKYRSLHPVICINILNFNLLKNSKNYHSTFMLREKNSNDYVLTDHLVIHYLELPKINNYRKDKNLEQWLYYLKIEGQKEEEENMKVLLNENNAIENAHKKYIAFTKDEELVDAYEAHMKWKRDYNTGIDLARQEGKYSSQLSIAKTMLQKNFNFDVVSEIIGIPIEELKKIVL